MPCYHPVPATRIGGVMHFGLRAIGERFELPCGQCIGCRLQRSGEWAIRLMQEAAYYTDKCFITLTYDQDNLPADRSLTKPHFQKFMKRLRKEYPGRRLKYFMCGEYGEKLGRPHYHAIIFGWSPCDAIPWGHHDGITTYRSDELADIWKKGFATVGEVTHESCGYVARYCMKKITGANADEHYFHVDEYGQLFDNLQPEYCTMSNGIGERHYRDWKDDIYPSDEMGIIRGGDFLTVQPPRYYDKLYSRQHPQEFEALKKRRLDLSKLNPDDQTPERLKVREYVKEQTTKTLKRKLECDSTFSASMTLKQKPTCHPSSFRLQKLQRAHSAIVSTLTTTSLENILRITRFTVSDHLRMTRAQLSPLSLQNLSVQVYPASNLQQTKDRCKNGKEQETKRKPYFFNGSKGRDSAEFLRPISRRQDYIQRWFIDSCSC